MIRYDLKCAEGHRFDSWFQSSSAYDKLAAAGMVSCAICGGTKVEKAIMAPRVSTSDKASVAPKAEPASDPAESPAPKLTENSDTEKMLTEMRKHIEKNATYVGGNFATEARAQHLGDAPERAIYGEAKPEDVKKLIEDDVPVAPLPFTPTRKTS